MLTFQEIISTLQSYWDERGCILLHPIDIEVGAGTSHVHTFLRAIGPEPWYAAYIQPSRRPKDGRYGKNPNRLQYYYQYQVVLKPMPDNMLELYINSLLKLGLDLKNNDLRFVGDDWENPTLGAWGVGWEACLNGMEITQLTYFQQVGGLDCNPILSEITYGLERIAINIQNVNNINEIIWKEINKNSNNCNSIKYIKYGEIHNQYDLEYSKYNFEYSNIDFLFVLFNKYEKEAKFLIEKKLILPSYEFILKAAHIFNLLDARKIISITERTDYISRIRVIARIIAKEYYKLRKELGFPMLKK